jgi:hypothetical protein
MDGIDYDLDVNAMYPTRKGVCTKMCPPSELKSDARLRDTVAIPFERDEENDDINPDLAVGSYRRAAAGMEIPVEEIRPLRTLWKALHFVILRGMETDYSEWSKNFMVGQLMDPQNRERFEELSLDELHTKTPLEVAAVILRAVGPDAISRLRKAREYADRLVAGQDALGIVKRCTYVSDRFRMIRFDISTQGLRGLAVITMTERMVRFRIISAFFSLGKQDDRDGGGEDKAWKEHTQEMSPLIEMYRWAYAEGKVECLARADEIMSYYMLILPKGKRGGLEQLLQQPWLIPLIRSPHVQVRCLTWHVVRVSLLEVSRSRYSAVLSGRREGFPLEQLRPLL